MKLRLKILGTLGLVFLATISITWLATVYLIQAEYVKLEADNVKKDTARTVDALGSKVDQLAIKLPDWSSWDDTYKYIVDRNSAYIQSNVQNSSLQSLSINFMMFYNSKQQLVESEGVDVDTGNTISLPSELTKAFLPGSQLLATKDTDQQRGILKTSTSPLILVSRPILKTDGTGPSRGTLVFAEYLSPSEVTKLGDVTHLNVSYDLASSADGFAVSEAAGTRTGVARTESSGSKTIAGYQLINDIYGKPALIAHVTEPRSIYQETQTTLIFYLLVISGVTLISLILAMVMTNRIVRQDRMLQIKNEFFKIASHELRTPLWAILGNSSLIKDTYGPKNDSKLAELADGIYDSSVRLIKIVTNFLDAARIEGGNMPVKLEAIDLEEPVKVAVSELTYMASLKSLYLKVELPEGLPRVTADAQKVQQIIYNLIGNAMKFTSTGGITITATHEREIVTLSVKNTGRGISKASQQSLFKSFEQTQSGDESVGSGLGLYISKLLVERMGGRIWLETSEVGKGTTISFSLPLTPGQTTEAKTPVSPSAPVIQPPVPPPTQPTKSA